MIQKDSDATNTGDKGKTDSNKQSLKPSQQTTEEKPKCICGAESNNC